MFRVPEWLGVGFYICCIGFVAFSGFYLGIFRWIPCMDFGSPGKGAYLEFVVWFRTFEDTSCEGFNGFRKSRFKAQGFGCMVQDLSFARNVSRVYIGFDV